MNKQGQSVLNLSLLVFKSCLLHIYQDNKKSDPFSYKKDQKPSVAYIVYVFRNNKKPCAASVFAGCNKSSIIRIQCS